MLNSEAVERAHSEIEMGARNYDTSDSYAYEEEALLFDKDVPERHIEGNASRSPIASVRQNPTFYVYIILAFSAGIASCALFQFLRSSPSLQTCYPPSPSYHGAVDYEYINRPQGGSTLVHHFPPVSPTNAITSLFPTNVGHAGATATGAEAALIATAPRYPVNTDSPQLIGPASFHKGKGGDSEDEPDEEFDLFKHWGNLSPWFSVPSSVFGLPHASPDPPKGCEVTGLHFLHRHGARYPTQDSTYAGPAEFAGRLYNATLAGEKWSASGDLEFLNDWTYKLGGELLTPFGRKQLFDLGLSLRLKYGFLLTNFTDSLPVFRTESQDRMLYSALNFAIGFFGYPLEGQYLQSITIEDRGFNNTLSPYKTCPNTLIKSKAERQNWYVPKWTAIYLKDARNRLQKHMKGFEFSIEDIYIFQQLCAYETVALGFSKFCELFTIEEWKGFNYALDLHFWYGSAYGAPLSRAQGIGYIQELIARLTHTPITHHHSSTNSTLDDDPTTFPLNNNLYVDATHEVVILNILTALNLTAFSRTGPLPYTHIPKSRSFKSSHISPFGANVQFQLLSCPTEQIRIIVNDGVVPMTGIEGCPTSKDGLCPLSTFIEAQKRIIAKEDWAWECHGDWDVPPGDEWVTVTGDAPPRPN